MSWCWQETWDSWARDTQQQPKFSSSPPFPMFSPPRNMGVTQVNTIHAVGFWSQLRNSKLRKPQSFLRGYKKNPCQLWTGARPYLSVCVSVSCSVMSDSLWLYGLLPAGLPCSCQARILEWVAIPFSRGSSWPRDQIPALQGSPALQANSLPSEPLSILPKALYYSNIFKKMIWSKSLSVSLLTRCTETVKLWITFNNLQGEIWFSTTLDMGNLTSQYICNRCII